MKKTFTDQMGGVVTINYPPKRIVSLVPSQTELLADLGLDAEIVGITSFCVHPSAWRQIKTIVGGTKRFNFDIIQELKPDLIIGNKEENYREGIERLMVNYPVWMSDITTLEDAYQMIDPIGEITGRKANAISIIQSIQKKLANVKKANGNSVLYLIWRKPWMAAGKNTFIDSMLTCAGLNNAVRDSRYPEVTAADITQINPQYIFLSSEPYPFSEKHIIEFSEIAPNATVVLVDGEMFSWYGSRLLKAAEYFDRLELN